MSANPMKTILLVNPWIHDFAAYDFWIKPLGLLYIASFLRKNGFKVEFIDCLDPWNVLMKKETADKPLRRFASGHGKYFKEIIAKPAPLADIPKNYHRYGITLAVFREMLKRLQKPQLILVTSMMTYWYPGVFETIRLVREIFSDVPLVLGGNYATLCPQHARLAGADHLLTGNGEEKLASLLEQIFGTKLSFIPWAAELDSYPYPAYDLIGHPEQLPIRTSRGCPFSCTYCASGLLNQYFQRRDPDKVFAEIEFWQKTLKVRHFSLYDDAFLIQPQEMAIPLLREIIGQRLPSQFHCPNGLHAREINEEVACLMYGAGFKTLRLGFETADLARQRTTGGKVSNGDLKLAVDCLRKAGYGKNEIGIYLLCGLPGQVAHEVEESILFVQSCGARPILAEFSPIPGTALWSEAVRVSSPPIETEPLYHNNSLFPCAGANFTAEMYRRLKAMTLAT